MGFLKVITTSTILLTVTQASSFTKIHDICDITKTQKCPNVKQEITLVQKFLNINSKNKIAVNGKWNEKTKEAIINFQKEHNIPATGYVGQMTKITLDKELAKKLAQINELKNIKNSLNKKNEINKENIAKNSSNIKTDTPTSKSNKTPSKKLSKVKKIQKINSYEAFRRSVNLRRSFAVYKDSKLLSRAKRAKTILKVDVSEQRVKLLVNGKVALSAPCTTGAKHKFEPNTRTYRDKHTPYGTFRIMEKIATKRSTIFVDIYRNGKRIYHGDRRKYRGSWKGVKVVGAPLYNWMRLTSGGIGLHASSHVKRYPGSNGCIRLPKNVSNLLFSKLKRGSIVKVVD